MDNINTTVLGIIMMDDFYDKYNRRGGHIYLRFNTTQMYE